MLQALLQDQILRMISSKYDILGFSKTRLDSNIVSLDNIYGYTIKFNHRHRHGGGLAMYVPYNYTSFTV